MVAAEGMSGGAGGGEGGRESGGAVTWYEEVVWRGRAEEEEEEEGGSVASEHGRERWLAGWRLAGEREGGCGGLLGGLVDRWVVVLRLTRSPVLTLTTSQPLHPLLTDSLTLALLSPA